jgi:hypothetical protein
LEAGAFPYNGFKHRLNAPSPFQKPWKYFA